MSCSTVTLQALAAALGCVLCVGCAPSPLRELVAVQQRDEGTQDGEARLRLEAQIPRLGPLPRDPVLEVPPIAETWVAQIDGQVVARHERPNGSGAAPGTATVLVPLRRSQLGGRLTLDIASRHLRIGPLAPLHVGERSEVVASILARDVGPLGVASLLGVGGLLVLLSLLGARRDRRARVALGGTLLSLAAYVLHYTQVRDLIVDAPRAFTIAWALAIPHAALGVVALTREIVAVPSGSRGARALSRTAKLLAVVATVYTSLAVGGQLLLPVLPLIVARPYYAMLIPLDLAVRAGVALTVAVVVPVVASVAGRDRSARLVLLGIAALGIASAIEVGLFLGGAKARWTSDMAWGALGLGVALAASFGARFAALRDEVERNAARVVERSKEREAMVHELHDGLGSLVTNIRMLAGVSERAPDNPQYTAIGTLAEEAIGELRAFTQATREEDTTWEALGADLRAATARLVSAHGRTFELTTEVAAGTPPPSSLAVLHVARIVREAVTNALKHTRAGGIHVGLHVGADGWQLEIADEGDAPGGTDEASINADWLSSGVGMRSMRARAEALGGRLDVHHDTGTLVRVVVPWTRQ